MSQSFSPRALFASIADRYDLANTVLSAGLHHGWKGQAIAAAGLRPGDRVLDAGTGTGDLARMAVRAGAVATGVDVSVEMLAVARFKQPPGIHIRLVAGDIEQLPFRAQTFDAVLTGFTLRHPTDLPRALGELRRVLVPAGRLVILEFSRPRSAAVRLAYDLYASRLIPVLGGWLTGHRDAYVYLVESIRTFPDQRALTRMIRTAGFEAVAYRDLLGGIVAVHTAVRSLDRR